MMCMALPSAPERSRRTSHLALYLAASAFVASLAACSSASRSGGTGGTTSSGGSTGTGGKVGTGGVTSTGGATGTGGTTSAGGTTSTGGKTSTGGATTTGGATSAGGATTTGGATSAGGATSSGGGGGSGGTSPTGGATSAGGITSAGGATSTGGTTSTGGVTSAGGTTSTGGKTSAGSTTGAGGATSAGGTTGGGGGTSAGGTTGAGGAGGSGGTGPAPFFTDNFDADTTGQAPSGFDAFIAYNLNGQNPSGTTLALVDETRAHSGNKSVHIHGGSSPAQIGKTLPTGLTRLYMRAFVYMTRQLGMHDPNTSNHESLFVLRKNPSGADNEVRFGEIKGTLGTNEVPTDDISPVDTQWGKGQVIPASDWVCVEVAFLGDLPQHQLLAYANGTLVHSITAPDQWEHMAAGPTFLAGKFVQAVFGWQSFSNVETDLWIDDVALSTGPIGCGP